MLHRFFPTVFCLSVCPATAVCFYPRSAAVCYSFGCVYMQLSLPRSVMSEPSVLIHELPWCHCQRPHKSHKTPNQNREFWISLCCSLFCIPLLMFLLFLLGEILSIQRNAESGCQSGWFPRESIQRVRRSEELSLASVDHWCTSSWAFNSFPVCILREILGKS